jgi:hypothetical protein
MKVFIVVFLIVIFLGGCDLSKPKDADAYEIKDIYTAIASDFLTFSLDSIYNRYSTEYLHDGNTIFSEQNWWRDKRDRYFRVDFENIQVNRIGDNFAEVSFLITFSGDNGESIYQEPGTLGNLSYLFKENGTWRIYGNQNS